MKFFITLSKKQLAVILALLVILLLTVGQLATVKANIKIGSTNALRVQYIKSLGLEPDDSNATVKNITIPQKFSKIYKDYNALQKKAGFNLEYYKGDKATVYAYPICGSEKELHLIVCGDKIIGGDVADMRVGGEIAPLLKQK